MRRCLKIPGLTTHLNTGIFLYPAYYFAFISIIRAWGIDYTPGAVDLVISYLAFIVGSDLPDIDHKDAPIRFFAQVLLLPLIFTKILDLLVKHLFRYVVVFMPDHLAFTVLLTLAVAIAFLILKSITALMKHRGFFHSISFALIYGALLYFFGTSLLHNHLLRLLFISIGGTCGVIVHLLLDTRGKVWKMKLW